MVAKTESSPKMTHALSVVSQKYDIDGDGKLDAAEKALRDMDTENVGHLSNEKVYELMQRQLKLQKQNVTQRKLIIGLSVFAVVLALANMGTAFAAARLAQDTKLTGPPQENGASSAGERRLNAPSPNEIGFGFKNELAEGAMISKESQNVVGTRSLSGTQVTLDVVESRGNFEPGPDDLDLLPGPEGGMERMLNRLPYSCVPLPTVSDMYNSISEGSLTSYRVNNPDSYAAAGYMSTSTGTLAQAGTSGNNVFFSAPGAKTPVLYVSLGDDRCDEPVLTRRYRNLRASKNKEVQRHLRQVRSRRIQALFSGLTHPDPRVRHSVERMLQDGNTDNKPLPSETSSESVVNERDDSNVGVQDEEEAGSGAQGDKPNSEKSQSDEDWLAEQLGLDGNFDSPFFLGGTLGDIVGEGALNRVPIFPTESTFYADSGA